MTNIPHLLIYSTPESVGFLDHSSLVSAGYDVIPISHLTDLEAWLISSPGETVLIICLPSPQDGLQTSAEILQAHPLVPILLVTNEINQSFLQQALEIGLTDYLTLPIRSDQIQKAINRGLAHLKERRAGHDFEQVMTNLTDGFILTDLNSHILLVNQSARQIFNIKDDQVEGKSANEIFYQQDFLDILKPLRTYPYRNEISMEDGRGI